MGTISLGRRFIMENSFEQVNLFKLSSGSIQITYSSTSLTGQPQLSYHDNNINRLFRGEELRLQDTEIGQLITVTLERIPDMGTVTFTLILPHIVGIGPLEIQVPGILTTAHTTIAGPRLGAEKTYSVENLRGTAEWGNI